MTEPLGRAPGAVALAVVDPVAWLSDKRDKNVNLNNKTPHNSSHWEVQILIYTICRPQYAKWIS